MRHPWPVAPRVQPRAFCPETRADPVSEWEARALAGAWGADPCGGPAKNMVDAPASARRRQGFPPGVCSRDAESNPVPGH
jgi:hypothetical protein